MDNLKPGRYSTVPLRTEEISVCVAQSWVSTRYNDIPRTRDENLRHLLDLVDIASRWQRYDLLVFHEFPLGGYDMNWTRADMLDRVAIDVPGPEIAAIGQKAKQYGCYIHFGSYAKLPDWPGHFMNMGFILGPEGDLVYQRWKTFNLPGFGFSTTVYDVLDEYVRRYGWDAVFPVARLDIGNIGLIPETTSPELSRAYGMKGAEIMIRYMTGAPAGYSRMDQQVACRLNRYYGIYVNNSLHFIDGVEVDMGSGGTAVIDPAGRILAEAPTHHESFVTARIPLGAYRKTHTLPQYPKALFQHLHENYVPQFPPNTFENKLPENIQEATRHFRQTANW